MLEFITASPNMAFSVALAVMLGIAALEIVTTLIGFSLSSVLDDMLPDFDAPEVDLDAEMDAEIVAGATASAADGAAAGADGLGGFNKVLDWFYVGRVPALILLVIALTVFGLAGYALQSIIQSATGGLMNGSVASAVAFLVSLPAIRGLAGLFARLVPKETTDAVSIDSLVGQVATVTLGIARAGTPAEAKLMDEKGQTHYVRVQPAEADAQFKTGTEVLLVKRTGTVFDAVAR